jgi:hypothetical protein
MATPPPSPLADKYTIAALQTAAHDSSTLYRPSCSGAVAALQFSASTKRRPSPQRSGDTHWHQLPIKRRLNTRVLPLYRITITDVRPHEPWHRRCRLLKAIANSSSSCSAVTFSDSHLSVWDGTAAAITNASLHHPACTAHAPRDRLDIAVALNTTRTAKRWVKLMGMYRFTLPKQFNISPALSWNRRWSQTVPPTGTSLPYFNWL